MTKWMPKGRKITMRFEQKVFLFFFSLALCTYLPFLCFLVWFISLFLVRSGSAYTRR